MTRKRHILEHRQFCALFGQLGASQPTLGRQIKAIEAQLGAELFRRQARGFALTQTGADLVGPAKTMRDAVRQITLTAAGQQARLEGTVRITASAATSALHLPPIIARIRKLEPQIASNWCLAMIPATCSIARRTSLCGCIGQPSLI